MFLEFTLNLQCSQKQMSRIDQVFLKLVTQKYVLI